LGVSIRRLAGDSSDAFRVSVSTFPADLLHLTAVFSVSLKTAGQLMPAVLVIGNCWPTRITLVAWDWATKYLYLQQKSENESCLYLSESRQ